MTPRERFIAAMHGRMPDRVPMVVWNNKLPNPEITKTLLEEQVCIVNKSSVYKMSTEGIEVETEKLTSIDGMARRKLTWHCNAGPVTVIERLVPGTVWLEMMPFCGPQDYEPLEELIRSKVYTPCFDEFLAADRMYPGQSLARPQTIYTPVQDLICKYMGVETYCVELADREDRLMQLCEVIAEDRLKRLSIVARSPAEFVVIEGNIITGVIGLERFEKNHLPYIEQGCRILHDSGRLASAHFDDNNRVLTEHIARTSLDIIESFTPPPDCDLGLSEALKAWPDKTVQINFPSSVHLQGLEAVIDTAKKLLREAAPGIRFIVGISEDISSGGVDTLVPLAETVYEHGKTPIKI